MHSTVRRQFLLLSRQGAKCYGAHRREGSSNLSSFQWGGSAQSGSIQRPRSPERERCRSRHLRLSAWLSSSYATRAAARRDFSAAHIAPGARKASTVRAVPCDAVQNGCRERRIAWGLACKAVEGINPHTSIPTHIISCFGYTAPWQHRH